MGEFDLVSLYNYFAGIEWRGLWLPLLALALLGVAVPNRKKVTSWVVKKSKEATVPRRTQIEPENQGKTPKGSKKAAAIIWILFGGFVTILTFFSLALEFGIYLGIFPEKL